MRSARTQGERVHTGLPAARLRTRLAGRSWPGEGPFPQESLNLRVGGVSRDAQLPGCSSRHQGRSHLQPSHLLVPLCRMSLRMAGLAPSHPSLPRGPLTAPHPVTLYPFACLQGGIAFQNDVRCAWALPVYAQGLSPLCPLREGSPHPLHPCQSLAHLPCSKCLASDEGTSR